jgi:hypothetical protein
MLGRKVAHLRAALWGKQQPGAWSWLTLCRDTIGEVLDAARSQGHGGIYDEAPNRAVHTSELTPSDQPIRSLVLSVRLVGPYRICVAHVGVLFITSALWLISSISSAGTRTICTFASPRSNLGPEWTPDEAARMVRPGRGPPRCR